ncbi:MAG: mechanosensitive ion channel domain-containing protein [Novosphingobium sp.]
MAALLLLLAPALPVSAQTPATTASAPATGTAAPAGNAEDARLAARISGIFSQIEALRDVKVRVSSGVVSLSGVVAATGDIARAETIASKLSGVVTVENRIERDLEVRQNLSPAIANLKAKALGFVRALPLFGVAAAIAALIGFLGHLLAGRTTLVRRIAPNVFLAELLATAIRFVFVIAGIVIALDILGATALLGAVLGGAGVLGVALGFAVRDTIDNYVSSLMLSIRQPFRAHDHVSIDGQEGRVARLTSRATILVTLDGNQLRIPNSTVFKAVIVNYTSNPERRFSFDVLIDAKADPLAALQIGGNALRALDFVLAQPRARGMIEELREGRTLLRFRGWLDQRQTDFGKGRGRAIAAVKGALDGAGFAVPDEVRHVMMVEDEAAAAPPAAEPRPAPRNGEADVRPDEHIETLVAEERATGKRKHDLLDAERPQE